ncbi:hypothetical protein PR048_008020 [Dryococelus australis]|uniref:MADF domain-containing protein n=1 Tax=Dryococelus australis TaxID=614101 RepID=A0ABQ9HVX1_9NEOP|nr:hypothetical protein PR048_008020 [Dryococelus australis]
MPRKEWARSDVKELISDYESRPVLCDVNTTEYRDRCRKHALKELAEEYKIEIQEITMKIHNLRNKFNIEFKKSQKNKSGQETDEKYVSKWPHYYAMLFIQKNDSQLTDTLDSDTEGLNDDGQDNATVPSNVEVTRSVSRSSTSTPTPPAKKKKATLTDKHSMMIEKVYETLSKNEDEFDLFGEYVASEMRKLSSVALKWKVKTEIQRIILQANEEDMRNADSTTTNHPWTVAAEYVIDDSVQSSELVIHGDTSQ